MLVLVCTVVFQERAAARLRARIGTCWEERVLHVAHAQDGWTRYRLARAALR